MKAKALLIIGIFLVLISSIAFAYPTLIIEKGVNKTQAKELVYSIPNPYFIFVDKIIFTNKPFAKCKIIDIFQQKKCWKNYAQAYWNNKHICYKTTVTMTELNRTRLIHEMNHIYDYCKNKVNFSTEVFADNFRI